MRMVIRELSLLKRIKGARIAFYLYPILIAFLLFAIFHAEKIEKLPIAIVDQDNSLTSQSIVRSLNSIQEVTVLPKYEFSDLGKAKESLLKGETYGVVYIPSNFEQHMLAGNSPELTTFYNNQFMTTGGTVNRAIYTGLTSILLENQVESLMSRGMPYAIATQQIQPINAILHPVFNPTINFVYTLVNGVYPAIIQILLMMLITASMQHEWANKEAFYQYCERNDFSILHILFKKGGIYFAYFLACFFLFDAALINYFNLHLAGRLTLLIIGEILFLIASIAMAMAISMIVVDKFRNYGAIGVLSSPAFGFTGLIFPHMSMNLFAQIWGSLLPVSWFINIRLNQSLRGADFFDSYGSYLALIIITLVSLAICQIKLYLIKNKGEISC